MTYRICEPSGQDIVLGFTRCLQVLLENIDPQLSDVIELHSEWVTWNASGDWLDEPYTRQVLGKLDRIDVSGASVLVGQVVAALLALGEQAAFKNGVAIHGGRGTDHAAMPVATKDCLTKLALPPR